MPHLFSFYINSTLKYVSELYLKYRTIFLWVSLFQYQYFFTYFLFLRSYCHVMHALNPISNVQILSWSRYHPHSNMVSILSFLFSVGLKVSSNFLATFSFDSQVYVCLHGHRSMINRFRDRSSNSAQPGSSFFSASTPPLNRSAGNGKFQKVKSMPICLQK